MSNNISEKYVIASQEQYMIVISNKETGQLIYSFINEDEDEDTIDPTQYVTFFKNDNIDFAVCETTDDMFPNFAIVNLETGSVNLVNPMMKGWFDKIWISEKHKLILVRGYIWGISMGHMLFDFDGNDVDLVEPSGDFKRGEYDGCLKCEDECACESILENDFKGFPTKYFSSIDYHSYTRSKEIVNGDLVLNIIMKKDLFDPVKFPNAVVNFDLTNFIEDGDTLVLPCCIYSETATFTDLVDIDEVTRIADYQKHCRHYNEFKEYSLSFDQPINLFKGLVTQQSSENTSIISNLSETDVKYFKNITSKQICDLTCNGIYSGNDYMCHWRNFTRRVYDKETFADFLASNTLGSEYHSKNSIPKHLLPDGVGLNFKVHTSDNNIFEFIIKMSMIELEEDNDRITYVKGKSHIDIQINRNQI